MALCGRLWSRISHWALSYLALVYPCTYPSTHHVTLWALVSLLVSCSDKSPCISKLQFRSLPLTHSKLHQQSSPWTSQIANYTNSPHHGPADTTQSLLGFPGPHRHPAKSFKMILETQTSCGGLCTQCLLPHPLSMAPKPVSTG